MDIVSLAVNVHIEEEYVYDVTPPEKKKNLFISFQNI